MDQLDLRRLDDIFICDACYYWKLAAQYSWDSSVICLSIANSPPYGGKTLPAKDWETVVYRIRKISVNEDHERPTHSVATRVLEGEETPYSHARLLFIA